MKPATFAYIRFKTIYRRRQGSMVLGGERQRIPPFYLCGGQKLRFGVREGDGYINKLCIPAITQFCGCHSYNLNRVKLFLFSY